MKLSDNAGTSFELDITDYQFDATEQESNPFSDCNWLMVQGKIVRPEKTWTFLDPCLTATELRALAQWFKKISENPAPRVISFMEPNLRFRFDRIPVESPDSPIGSKIGGAIHVTLTHESASHWTKHTFPGFDELVFLTLYNDPAAIAAELTELSSRFPPRSPTT